LRGVVGRSAIVGRAEDQHAALLRQFSDVVIQRCEFGGKTVDFREIGDAGRKFFRAPEVGAVEHEQRSVVSRPRTRSRRRGSRRRGGRGLAGIGATFLVGARTDLDLEAIRLDGQRFLEMHLVTVVVDQLEALQDHADRKCRLMHRKASADAGALAVAERFPGVDRPLGFRLLAEILRIERVGIGSPN
jgi:hypothetical protein